VFSTAVQFHTATTTKTVAALCRSKLSVIGEKLLKPVQMHRWNGKIDHVYLSSFCPQKGLKTILIFFTSDIIFLSLFFAHKYTF
jgi:hypothetical protein